MKYNLYVRQENWRKKLFGMPGESIYQKARVESIVSVEILKTQEIYDFLEAAENNETFLLPLNTHSIISPPWEDISLTLQALHNPQAPHSSVSLEGLFILSTKYGLQRSDRAYYKPHRLQDLLKLLKRNKLPFRQQEKMSPEAKLRSQVIEYKSSETPIQLQHILHLGSSSSEDAHSVENFVAFLMSQSFGRSKSPDPSKPLSEITYTVQLPASVRPTEENIAFMLERYQSNLDKVLQTLTEEFLQSQNIPVILTSFR